MHPIHIGTCGWSYWSGVFYPRNLPSAEYLSYYAEKFHWVEVDSTFYASPSPKMVQGWNAKTPARSSFALKVPQTITHDKLMASCDAEVEEFLAAARLLEDKLQCCVLQFGYLEQGNKGDASTHLFFSHR
jgi:uncharacterized protein YecE (DUF72 family)